jgi:hypothetical protein
MNTFFQYGSIFLIGATLAALGHTLDTWGWWLIMLSTVIHGQASLYQGLERGR